MEQEHTKFLLETNFICDNHKRVLLLFNDFFIIGKAHRNGQLKVKEKIELQVVFYETVKTDPTALVLKTPYGVYNLSGTAQDVKTWVEHLEEYLPSRKRNPTFGRSIKEILEREGTEGEIPSIVTQCLNCIIDQGGLKTEGLFRISGERTEITALKELFDNYSEKERDLTKYNIHAICGVLKLWFRELPEPLMPFSLYDKIVHLERENPDDKLEQYTTDIMPNLGETRPTLEYLIRFLRQMCENSAANKMSASNASIVFGPTLVRAKVETIETTLNSPIVNSSVQVLIENFDHLFGTKSD
eukprot:CAMPEP_0117012312 /NCGR_PEP_ID=MMETSP0472-20121206/10391_1 /TAXON_ID=693140 ORGANISM="Tiarina fusus, Strain LIS" /NCGR_SAMPLE_ID=MMETSP0472 /ASSEMBLY_ACC=CAM_ASM_000603 /LENGTH=299 /DNA_ID=CAMNT_0004715353 /DNA_START=254 /DNA_END=1153 /DNA_ORIENTATION=+